MRFSVNLVSKWSCHPKFHQCEENLIGQTLQSHIHRCSKAIYSAHHPMHFCSACLCRPWWEFIDPSLEGRGHLVNHHIVNWKCSSFEKSFRHRVLIFVFIYLTQFSSVQSLSRVQLFVTPWTVAHQASCASPSPRVGSNSCPSSWWCRPTISSSIIPFFSCLQSFLASGSFLMSRLFAPGGQSIGASASVLPINIQGWFPLGFTGLIS